MTKATTDLQTEISPYLYRPTTQDWCQQGSGNNDGLGRACPCACSDCPSVPTGRQLSIHPLSPRIIVHPSFLGIAVHLSPLPLPWDDCASLPSMQWLSLLPFARLSFPSCLGTIIPPSQWLCLPPPPEVTDHPSLSSNSYPPHPPLGWCKLPPTPHPLSDVGLVVKAYALRVADPQFDSCLCQECSGLIHTSDLKTGTPVATLPGAWCYRVSAVAGWPGGSIPWLSEIQSLICYFYLRVAARTIVWADPSPRYTSMWLGH